MVEQFCVVLACDCLLLLQPVGMSAAHTSGNSWRPLWLLWTPHRMTQKWTIYKRLHYLTHVSENNPHEAQYQSAKECPARDRKSHETRSVPQCVMLYVYIPVSLPYPTSSSFFLPSSPPAVSSPASEGLWSEDLLATLVKLFLKCLRHLLSFCFLSLLSIYHRDAQL